MPSLRILVADDHEIVRGGICAILQKHPGWQVCGEVADGRLAVAKCLELRPDLAILDIGMPNLNGLEATRQITNSIPHVRVLIFSVSGSEHAARKALEAGAHGFLLKSDAGNELINAVEALRNNRPFWHLTAQGGFFQRPLNSYRVSSEKVLHQVLSRRELQVLQLIAEGKVSKDIASALGVGFKNCRNPPVTPYAQTGFALGSGIGSVCREKRSGAATEPCVLSEAHPRGSGCSGDFTASKFTWVRTNRAHDSDSVERFLKIAATICFNEVALRLGPGLIFRMSTRFRASESDNLIGSCAIRRLLKAVNAYGANRGGQR